MSNQDNNSWKPNDKAIIIAAIIGAMATLSATFFSLKKEVKDSNAPVTSNQIITSNKNDINITPELKSEDEQMENTTVIDSETLLYEYKNTSTVTNEVQDSHFVTTNSPISDSDQSSITDDFYTETTYHNKTAETTIVDSSPFYWNYSDDKNVMESSVNETTISENIWSDYVYEVTLEKQEPNLLRFTVQGDLNLFSLPDEQIWETAFKSENTSYAARLTTIGKDILSNKVMIFEYKNDGYYYSDTDIPISSYYDNTKDIFIIEVLIDDANLFESASLKNNTISEIHYFN